MGYDRDMIHNPASMMDICHHQRTKKNCIYCEELAAKDTKIVELAQQVRNLEEYMLKGVAFRDELQSRLALLKKVAEAARNVMTLFDYPTAYHSIKEQLVGELRAALDALKEG